MKKILTLFLLLNPILIFSQNDCSDAIVVCGNDGYQNLTAIGVGIQELNGSNTCGSEENNSLWFKVTINTAGNLGFTLTPTDELGNTNTDLVVDFDFFLFGPNVDCGNIGQAIRCSTTNPLGAGSSSNLTGMNTTETDTAEGPGVDGNNFVSDIDVLAGESYFLVIDRPAGTSNFKIDWIGSATFNDPPIATPPSIGEVYDQKVCDTDGVIDNSSVFDLTLNEGSILNGQTNILTSYHTSINDAITNENPIADPINFINTSSPQDIYVRLTDQTTLCFDTTDFQLLVPTQPTANTPNAYEVCDDLSSDGYYSNFLLNSKDSEVLITQDQTLFNISYHLTFNDADNNMAPLDKENPYTNISQNTQTIFVRIENKTQTDCYEITSFDLVINSLPVVNNLINIEECDIDGDATVVFDLSVNTSESLGLQINTTVSYFISEIDAQSNNAPLINPSAFTNTSSPQTIYIRLSDNNSGCFIVSNFTISATSLPIPIQPIDYEICDDNLDGDDTNGFVQNFLLSSKDNEILGSLDASQYAISYHTSLIGAQTNNSTDVINKFNPYSNTSINSQQVFVRVENIDNTACNDTSISFNLIVDPLPVVNTGVEINYCIATGDPNPTVNLTQAENQISSTIGARFEYFKDSSGTDLILDPVFYPPVGNVLQSVYVKVISDQGCARDLVELVLNIGETPNNSFDDLVAQECDDFLDSDGNDTPGMNDDTDNITNFSLDLTAIIAAISPPPFTQVFFYESNSDRNSNSNNIPDLTNYRNDPTNIDITVVPDGIRFPIYYKILSTINNDCEGIGQFYLQINQVPTVNPYGDLILCDDGDDGDFVNGIVQTFDLESQTPIILGTQDPLKFTVTYHISDTDALSGANQILNTTMYENTIPNLETIYVRVANNTTTCFTNHTSFDLIVNELPIANFVDDLEVCDDNTDGSAQNGISQSFDLNLQTAGILGSQDPTQFSVTYHASLTNAQAGILPLGSPFSNSVPFSQIIYARVYNSLTGCANGISNFNAIVNPEPTTENASNLSFCDDDLDGDDTNGFLQNIDLDSQITAILGPLQDPDDFTVTFHETQADASAGTDALSSPYTNTTADQQTIFVRVVNDDTLCVNDDFTFDVIINPLPDFKVTSPQIVCLSGPPLTLFVENPAAVYDYVWTAPNGNESFGSQITIESGGLYTVTATTTNGTLCTRTREIQVNESIVATITDADVTIVDDSENNSISIDPTNLGIGDYQYALINEDGIQTTYQDIPLFENLTGGFYTIVVEDKNGCRPNATLEVSVIEYPKFFTPNNDGINDTWAIKGANSTFYPTAQINIFNRFGKVVAQIEVDTPGWTGTYGGKTLPSDDYWFSIILIDRNGNARERKGNFSLLRR